MNPLNLYKYLPHLLRKKFKEKYIIIESDDWGLERGLRSESIEWAEKKFGDNKFSRWTLDSLETIEDLDLLYDLLDSYKQKFDSPPVITANFITHNIDYSKVNKLNFIPLTTGFNESSEDVRGHYKKGIRENYIYPQLHGYSHFNISEVEKYFYTEEGAEALEKGFFGARSTIKGNLAFLQGELSNFNKYNQRIEDAAKVFEEVFGFRSVSIIPPTFILDRNLISILLENNIRMLQSSNRLIDSRKKRFRFPYFQRRKGLHWSIRNARLDPHPEYKFYHEQCINSIEKAFANHTPAIIDFHRVNFAGRFAKQYRETTLKELRSLLNKIYLKWPEVKFIHTQTLNEILWQQ